MIVVEVDKGKKDGGRVRGNSGRKCVTQLKQHIADVTIKTCMHKAAEENIRIP
jgi:hypothetical protein